MFVRALVESGLMDAPAPTPLDLTELSRWLAELAAAGDDGRGLLEGVCRQLLASGLPLLRVRIGTPALDPRSRGFTLDWHAERGVKIVLDPHGPDAEAAWMQSPIFRLLQEGGRAARWRLDALTSEDDIPLLHELSADGACDYLLRLMPMAPETQLRGVAFSFATRRSQGFSEREIATIESLLPTLSLAVARLRLSTTLRDVLATYVGGIACGRILDGAIQRGQGNRIWAAILLTDLRGFTTLSDRADPLDTVGWLDEHFDVLGDPVARHGGEILKFLGDGFLATFPVEDGEARPCLVCGRALDAAREALAANAALNHRRRAAGLPELEADAVLHFGEVIYGNVGTSDRLDFTVIGRAVNEASRIEGECEALGRTLLISESFAARCGRALAEAGTVTLRGLSSPQRLWTVEER